MSEKPTHREPIKSGFTGASKDPIDLREERQELALARKTLRTIREKESDGSFVGGRTRDLNCLDF